MNKIVVIICLSFLGMGIFGVIQYYRFYDNKLHIVVCDVGQGDSIFIKTPRGKTLLIDGGPDNSVLACLSEYMPFWHKKIDVVVLTHPHADHLQGLISVIDDYLVKSVYTEALSNTTQGYKEFLRRIQEKKIPFRTVLAGDILRTSDQVSLTFLAPTQEFLLHSSPNGIIGENKEFASLIIQLSYREFDALFTGDSQATELHAAVNQIQASIEVFQVPHHGSYSGLTEDILKTVRPSRSFISVGNKNRYNHPAPVILKLLESAQIPVYRTDYNGTLDFISDGSRFNLAQ